jgi:hypothetical protein
MVKTMLAVNQHGFNPFLFSGRIFERKSKMPGPLEEIKSDKKSLWVGLNIRKRELSVKPERPQGTECFLKPSGDSLTRKLSQWG